MSDRLRGHEKPAYGAEIFPPADSVLGKLNQIHNRLRQLEKERSPESSFAAEHRGRSTQLLPDMDNADLKKALRDRLNVLETRIRQLSQEMDKGGSSRGGGNSMMAITFPAEKQKQIPYSSSSGLPCRAGTDNYQKQMSKKKSIEPMQAATTKAMDKMAAAFCHNEKRKMDSSRLYKRWFQIGC